jgi:hypothetical protein
MSFAQYQVTLSRKVLVGLYANMHIQITLWAIGDGFALFAQPYGRAIIDARRYLECNGLGFLLRALSMADATDFFGHLSRPLAGIANYGLPVEYHRKQC